ncbi:TetR/AcrR family transcriptional regulator [Actinosynnema mirum]|uniref:Transcriptional regulator, TetR family n=1 Tax=Actinosynnema mirum (strain ATCC 29888 / DSM 43827 / JCM 3225 / NBRC 14064 / NCIMB 13271 / NRRL B-12336 / IMRU 3971 / 101) TaxID=446462 RepID=C6WD77_ACTMD|nr:TetR/AcrR family transcriptional regulator C-terminal domain-containing protein [Actinosynnema mirum]ACU37696.1 transcriptional regulator, TetR family [Actinosynnema mirum DSM 43827]
MTPRPSRRERPAKPALTRDGIIATAVGVLRAEGLDKVTMRRLAAELDTGPASLYVYVRNTGELHAAVLDTLLGEVDRPAATGPWLDRLTGLLSSYTRVLFAHPGLARSALVSRPHGPNYVALVDAVLGLLHEGGVPVDRAAWALDVLLQLATATAAEHSEPGADDAEQWAALSEVVRTADPTTHPHIARAGDHLLSGTGPDRLTWAFAALVAGAAHTPRESTP